ncbi:hypothetical protein FH972_025791 [Carpinus fangiana]|uniref:Uncharacterized protein n=1 Tax=Carpinus fangiana TaxID=176857 RepID=A0A5N6L2L9_9ROSI|nr:hypothetical protein FH972_025791 [Carpinus fangiana]
MTCLNNDDDHNEGNTIETKFARGRSDWKRLRNSHIPISPSPPHPDSGIIFGLRTTNILDKAKSNVCISRSHVVSCDMLDSLRRGKADMDPYEQQFLIRVLQRKPPPTKSDTPSKVPPDVSDVSKASPGSSTTTSEKDSTKEANGFTTTTTPDVTMNKEKQAPTATVRSTQTNGALEAEMAMEVVVKATAKPAPVSSAAPSTPNEPAPSGDSQLTKLQDAGARMEALEVLMGSLRAEMVAKDKRMATLEKELALERKVLKAQLDLQKAEHEKLKGGIKDLIIAVSSPFAHLAKLFED